MANNKLPSVTYRHCEDMEHIIVYAKNDFLLDDSCEGFPKLTTLQVLECLEKGGIIDLEIQEIIDEE